ncbi:serine hydrolase [Virgibacillus sp. MG-45]|uniref:serine hydrolase n=1 Tax=Virgibacillus sp. MG-45 TaxID=3102791 RepID=UPI002ED7B606
MYRMKKLTARIQHIIENTNGKWGIVLEDLDRNERWYWNANEPFYAASVIKVPIMMAVFHAAHNGDLSLDDELQLKQADQVGGAGVLQYMTPGIKLPIYDVMMLMIIQSDNTATNMLIDLLGEPHIQQRMVEYEFIQSKFYNKLMIVPAVRKGNNTITAAEMNAMLKKLALGKVISAHACEQMIAILKKQQIQDGLPGRLASPEPSYFGGQKDWEIAHKTGNVQGINHDIGIFYVGKRQLIASVLSKDMDDLVARNTIQLIGREIYDYLHITKNESVC